MAGQNNLRAELRRGRPLVHRGTREEEKMEGGLSPWSADSTLPTQQVGPAVEISEIRPQAYWDKDESALLNVTEWTDFAESASAVSTAETLTIPKVIHQIWIGPKAAPCVWLDRWRLGYVRHRQHEWSYILWDDERVAAEFCSDPARRMINADLYERETAWQCKADILRLEILYRYGGVYVDADIVPLARTRLDSFCSATSGLVLAFEPGSGGKHFDVIANSVIFARKSHPLVLLLIRYLLATYEQKRVLARLPAEWCTGPLMFSKALQLPGDGIFLTKGLLTVHPAEAWYPLFHYIPDPSSVDTSGAQFEAAQFLQFGYTCSNLEQWIATNNICKIAEQCPYHCKISDWPFGKKASIQNIRDRYVRPRPSEPSETGAVLNATVLDCGNRIIHHFVFADDAPERWITSWIGPNFTKCFGTSAWDVRRWTLRELEIEGLSSPFLGSNLYRTANADGVGVVMGDFELTLLALEILLRYGGLFVPVTAILGKTVVRQPSADLFGFVPPRFAGDLIYSDAGSAECFEFLCQCYHAAEILYDDGRDEASEARWPAAVSFASRTLKNTYTSFCLDGERRMFMGIERVCFVPQNLSMHLHETEERSLLKWSYFTKLDVSAASTFGRAVAEIYSLTASDRRTLLLLDRSLLRNEFQWDFIPECTSRMDRFVLKFEAEVQSTWHVLFLRLGWCNADYSKTDKEKPLPCEIVEFDQSCLDSLRRRRQAADIVEDRKGQTALVTGTEEVVLLGIIFNFGAAAKLRDQPGHEKAETQQILFHQLEAYAQSYPGTTFMATYTFPYARDAEPFFDSLHSVTRAFSAAASGYKPHIHFDTFERRGNVFAAYDILRVEENGHVERQLTVEVCFHGQSALTFKSFLGGSVSCEMSLQLAGNSGRPKLIQWARVFENHQCVVDLSNVPVS
ncbi:Inositol phosphoceramide mannosyltransferase 3 [Porphyridium purpureum]|uniref:Inositol phosphoceramide mannosyltransferase 3 n=1 Tax=Porphyridium purpureum TaxID=35688 RepID=A0A5J4YWJ1_PORPP|nr:Inositol phosphoceramide mannosyltransferase 3 [Porphyridium purpureum]|eukprot:POR6478..scf227_4